MNVHFDLQEGFQGDDVTISVGQKQIFHAEQVKTRMQIGLAASFEVELAGEKAEFKIEIPIRNIIETKEIALSGTPHIAVSLTDENKLVWKVSEWPFYYM